MAQPLYCDVCAEEPAAQLLTNVENGQVLALGLNCLPVFYHQSLLTLLEAGEHTKIPSKCQTCRRVHEQMIMVPVVQGDTETAPTPADQPAPAETG